MNRIPFEVKKYNAENTPSHKIHKVLMGHSNQSNNKDFIQSLRMQKFDDILLDEKFLIAPPDKIDLPKFINSENADKDVERAINLHEALNIERLEEACDPRLWSYLSLVVYRDYISERWKLDKKKPSVTETRMFYQSSSTNRNAKHALARLWWSVEMTKNLDKDDPYAYTRQLLGKGNSQIMFDLIERRYIFRNRNIIKSYLDFFKNHEPNEVTETSGKLVKFLYNHIRNFDLRFWSPKEIDNLLLEFYMIIKPKKNFFFGS